MPLVETHYRGSRAHFDAYRALIHAAQDGQLLTYKPLFDILALKPGNYAQSRVGQLLSEIGEDAHNAGLPLLTAIVVGQTSHRPGSGFFELAKILGQLPAGTTERQRELFWESEVKRVYSARWPLSGVELRRAK